MKILGKLFGGNKPKRPDELVFKSTMAAFEYELKTNPCQNPAAGDLVMGIVLHVYKRKDGVQFAHVVSNVVSEPLNEEEVYQWLPGVEENTISYELMQLAKSKGKIIANASCTDHMPQLQAGDFVAVHLSMVMPSGMLMGMIVQVAQPILNPQYGWKSRQTH